MTEQEINEVCDTLELVIFNTQKTNPQVSVLNLPKSALGFENEDALDVLFSIEAEMKRRNYKCEIKKDGTEESLFIQLSNASLN